MLRPGTPPWAAQCPNEAWPRKTEAPHNLVHYATIPRLADLSIEKQNRGRGTLCSRVEAGHLQLDRSVRRRTGPDVASWTGSGHRWQRLHLWFHEKKIKARMRLARSSDFFLYAIDRFMFSHASFP